MSFSNNYPENNQIIDPVPIPKYQKKIQVSKQAQDNLRILDCMIRTMSTVYEILNIMRKNITLIKKMFILLKAMNK